MQDLIKAAINQLKIGHGLVMATIIQHQGSTPRETGARFLINQDGSTFGTIGGGAVESEVTAKGRELFAGKHALVMQFDMTHLQLSAGGMICGGNLTVLLDYLAPNSEMLLFLAAWEECYRLREPATLILKLEVFQPGKIRTSYALARPSGASVGNLACSQSLMQNLHAAISNPKQPALITNEDCRYWVEPLLFPKKLILFGAGHVAKYTAGLGVQIGFETTVIDDRTELLNKASFPEPIRLRQVSSFEQACGDLTIDSDCFLVILTRSHAFDKTVLSQVLQSKASYLGMIGSKRKRDTIFQSLLSEGHRQDDLTKVHSPIGLEIGASTPEEIAVSIIAQLIQVRARLVNAQTA